MRPTRGLRTLLAAYASLPVSVASIFIALVASNVGAGFVGAIAWVIAEVWIVYRSARVSTTLSADTIIARNLFVDHVIERDRVSAFEDCSVIWSKVSGYRARVSAPTFIERMRGGIPLEGTASFDVDTLNRQRLLLQSWRNKPHRWMQC